MWTRFRENRKGQNNTLELVEIRSLLQSRSKRTRGASTLDVSVNFLTGPKSSGEEKHFFETTW